MEIEMEIDHYMREKSIAGLACGQKQKQKAECRSQARN
jgi:hypothetical protein